MTLGGRSSTIAPIDLVTLGGAASRLTSRHRQSVLPEQNVVACLELFGSKLNLKGAIVSGVGQLWSASDKADGLRADFNECFVAREPGKVEIGGKLALSDSEAAIQDR